MIFKLTNDILWQQELCGDSQYEMEMHLDDLKKELGIMDESKPDSLLQYNTKRVLLKEIDYYHHGEDDEDDEDEELENEEDEEDEEFQNNKTLEEHIEEIKNLHELGDICSKLTNMLNSLPIEEWHNYSFIKAVKEQFTSMELYNDYEPVINKFIEYLELSETSNGAWNLDFFMGNILDSNAGFHFDSSKDPDEWFDDQDIINFINENLGPAKTEEEKQIDEILSEINRLNPETLSYYEFPEKWKQNGIADLIKANCRLF